LSPWQSWKIAYLVLNNNHSLTDNSSQQNMSRIQNSQFEYIVLTFTTFSAEYNNETVIYSTFNIYYTATGPGVQNKATCLPLVQVN
jgi:hypothetical protein